MATDPIRPLTTWFGRTYRLLTEQPLSLYATACLRIGYGFLHLVLLLREFPHRHEIWGPESPWTFGLAREMYRESGWFSLLTLSHSDRYFELCYAVAVLSAILFMLGWRTRATAILFAVMAASFYGRNVLITDGGDNLALLMAVYLPFTACGRRWSLDARRLRRQEAADHRATGSRPAAEATGGLRAEAGIVRRFAVTVVHNCAVLIIMAQMCILYGAAGLYKVQGSMWEDGTALHYVLNLGLFRPWPALSSFMDSHYLMIGVASYVTVLAQVAFPFSLFSKLKYVLLPILAGMHLGIAVVVGLPMFSAFMIVGDLVFLPDRFYRFAAGKAREARAGRAARQARRRRLPSPALDTP